MNEQYNTGANLNSAIPAVIVLYDTQRMVFFSKQIEDSRRGLVCD